MIKGRGGEENSRDEDEEEKDSFSPSGEREGEEGVEREREWWKGHGETKGCLKEEPFGVPVEQG